MSFISKMQGYFNICKLDNVIHHINKLKHKKKKHMIISIDAEIAFDKIQSPFMIQTPQKVGMEVTHLSIMGFTYGSVVKNPPIKQEI